MAFKRKKKSAQIFSEQWSLKNTHTAVTLPALELGLSFCGISICGPPSSSFARFRAIGRSTFPAKPPRFLHIVVT